MLQGILKQADKLDSQVRIMRIVALILNFVPRVKTRLR